MSAGIEYSQHYLGPVFERFCYRLWLADQFHVGKPAAMLFLSRGGLRLRHFYETFLEHRGVEGGLARHDFYLSRMSVFRALLISHPNVALPRIAGEYGRFRFFEGMQCFLPAEVFEQWQQGFSSEQREELSQVPFTEQRLHDAVFLWCDTNTALLAHLREQAELIQRHFSETAGDAREVVLVDTGWSGSIIQGMKALFPAVEFKAAMVGRYNYGGHYPEWFSDIVGLEAEGVHYDPSDPVTSLFHHRHVIEALCEPRWPSVEYYRCEEGVVIPAQGAIPEHLRQVSADEPLAHGVDLYLHSRSGRPEAGDIHLAAEQAATRLQRLICYPSSGEARAFSVTSRSADFGTDLEVAMLIDDDEGSKHDRIIRSLWLQGQAALEFGALRHIPQWLITHRHPIKKFYDRVLRKLRLRK
jgi:hypothetical protein